VLDVAWPWILLLLPLPWLLGRLRPPRNVSGHSRFLRVPHLQAWQLEMGESPRGASQWLTWVGWLLLLLAAARPEWLGQPISQPRSGRDLMIAVDLSKSMGSMDFELQSRLVTRLVASQVVAGEFIDHRVGDRLGLILFGERAYLQAPLTFDRSTVRYLLQEAELGLAGRSTAIGDAVGLAVKRLRESQDASSRVLILLTDGENTAGELQPEKAAELAAENGIRIYTIGVAADTRDSAFGLNGNTGEVDEAGLKAMAEKTGGSYFRARDTEQLRSIYAELDRLEPAESDAAPMRPRAPLFMYPLALGLLTVIAVLHARGASRE
jgi:Ca-activated chloride channel homolog